jgi:hypothetical protein
VTTPPTDQEYVIGGTPATTSYTVPAFTSNPPGATITYTDVSTSKPASVILSGLTYDWST